VTYLGERVGSESSEEGSQILVLHLRAEDERECLLEEGGVTSCTETLHGRDLMGRRRGVAVDLEDLPSSIISFVLERKVRGRRTFRYSFSPPYLTDWAKMEPRRSEGIPDSSFWSMRRPNRRLYSARVLQPHHRQSWTRDTQHGRETHATSPQAAETAIAVVLSSIVSTSSLGPYSKPAPSPSVSSNTTRARETHRVDRRQVPTRSYGTC
jgi:hypothetical protein